MTLAELVDGFTTGELGDRARIEVRGVTSDSRQVRDGFVYVAIPGAHRDGADYVPDAISRGAVAVVAEGGYRRNGLRGAPNLACDDARRTVARLASRYHGEPSQQLAVVGVTGTNGKTTTAALVRDILAADDRTPGLLSTVSYDIGARSIPAERTTPEAPTLQYLLAQMVTAGCASAVMEVSSHALDQSRCEGVAFDAVIFTNLTRDHLDYHGSMAQYFEAKARLFERTGAARDPWSVINGDDPWGQQLAARNADSTQQLTYAQAVPADVRAEDVSVDGTGSRFRMTTPWGATDIRLPLMGRYNVSNALAAVAACGSLGVALDDMVKVLECCAPMRGRLEPVVTGRGFSVFVDYAHTDDALRNVLSCCRELVKGRMIVVFGCGGDRDRSKRPLMGAAVAELSDVAVLTSDNPRREDPDAIIRDVLSGMPAPGDALRVEPDRRSAIVTALELAADGDVVVIAGKGHETFQEVAGRTLPFDDRQVVRAWAGLDPNTGRGEV